jgi:hypothetical protein
MLLRDHAGWRWSEESDGCSVVDGLDGLLRVATVAWRWRRELKLGGRLTWSRGLRFRCMRLSQK